MTRTWWGGWRRSPAYATTVALVVALVVLANAVAFSTAWSVLYKPLPYRDAGELVELRIDLRDIDFQVGLSHAMYLQVREAGGIFAGAVGSAEPWQPRLDQAGMPWRIQRVTPDFTDVLGVQPSLGRALSDSAEGELLLSDRTWRQRFGADPGVLGRSVRIGDAQYMVVGVTPSGFGWPDSGADAWTRYVPTAVEREQELAGGFGVFHVAARLVPGATTGQASARLDGILRNSGNEFLRDNIATARPDARPWRARFTTGAVQPLLMLQAATLLLLLVAAANLANLTVERVTARRGEFAVRRALGARWKDLLGVLLADLLPPSLVGAASGLALALPVLGLVQSRGLVPDRLVAPEGLDTPLLAAGFATAALVLVAATLAGTLSAAAMSRPSATVAQAGRNGPVRTGMLVGQIALATILCGSAGLLLRSALVLHAEDRGFDARGVLLTQVDLTALHGDAGSGVAPALQRLRDAIEREPGVTHVALADMPPFGGAEFKAAVLTAATPEAVDVRSASVGASYFEAMGIPLLAGSVPTDAPSSDVIPVVVDELFRSRWLPGEEGVGATIRLVNDSGPPVVAQVVGIAAAVKQRALSEPGHPTLYLPIGNAPGVVFLVTRTQGDPAELAGLVQRELQRIAPAALLMVNQPLASAIWTSTAAARSLTELAVLLGGATGLLCALGCFALVGAAVNRRRAELGLRSALGATSRRIQVLVLRRGAALVVAGVLAGLAMGMVLSHAFADRLYRTAPTDATTWLWAACLVAVLALLACWLPARAAARVPPTLALAEGTRQL